MSLIKLQIIDFESRHKFIFSFGQSPTRSLLPYKNSVKPTKKINKQYNIIEKGKVFRQKRLTKWIY